MCAGIRSPSYAVFDVLLTCSLYLSYAIYDIYAKVIVLWMKMLCLVLKIFVLHQNRYTVCEAAIIFDNNIEVFTKTE